MGKNGKAGVGEVGRADLTRQPEAFVSIQGVRGWGRVEQGFLAELGQDSICCELVIQNREVQGGWYRDLALP